MLRSISFKKIRLHQVTIFLGLVLILAPNFGRSSTIINIDVGGGSNVFSGSGVIHDPGNTYWNNVNSSGSNLVASDGVTVTSVSFSLTSAGGFSYPNENSLLSDYQFTNVFFGNYIGDLNISGLQANTDYQIVVFSSGDQDGQSALIELNGVRSVPSGKVRSDFKERQNYVVMEVTSDENGEIIGNYRPFDRFAAINGVQIALDNLPTRVEKIAGATSPIVHSPNDTIRIAVHFSESVVLSEVGSATVDVEFDGIPVTAKHVGKNQGDVLYFETLAPSATAEKGKILGDSLKLINSATLLDLKGNIVSLGHTTAQLPNDQISVNRLSVYPQVPDLDPSPHYRFRVKEVGQQWQRPFAWYTKAIDYDPSTENFGYYNRFIGGWSHTYANFEMANNVPVLIEITRIDPVTGEQIDIETALPHPRRNVLSWKVRKGRAYIKIDKPSLFTVDINGEMDNFITPNEPNVNEKAIHTVSVFANPFILDKPDPLDPDVYVVQPGSQAPDDGTWKTLYFAPGVHQLFAAPWDNTDDFRLRSNRSYYIPGDAIVHGAMNNGDDDSDGENIRIYGHGTLSGERIPHFLEQGLPDGESNPDSWRNRSIRIANNAQGSKVEGITIADAANHSVAIVGWSNVDPDDYNYIRWTKVITWRANGDGISANGSGYVEDNFLRTQDDGTYVQGFGVKRMIYWADVNGMPLRGSNMLNVNPAPYRIMGDLVVEDIDILYSRTRFGGGPGRSMIGFPDPAQAFYDNDGSHIVFRNIRVEDKYPTRTLFGWDLNSGNGGTVGPRGIRFENIRAAARNLDQELDPFLGSPNAPISDLTFDNVLLAGEHYKDINDLETNEFVSNFNFTGTEPSDTFFESSSARSKWYFDQNWSTGVEPANNDRVYHTLSPTSLIVDATAYAGSVTIAHQQKARLKIIDHGHLHIAENLIIGDQGRGKLNLKSGNLTLSNESSDALFIGDGKLVIQKGELNWSGNHIDDLKALFSRGAIAIRKGNVDPIFNSGVLIGKKKGNYLFAVYDPQINATKAWVYKQTNGD